MLPAHPMINSIFASYLLASIPPGIIEAAADTAPIEVTRPTCWGVGVELCEIEGPDEVVDPKAEGPQEKSEKEKAKVPW